MIKSMSPKNKVIPFIPYYNVKTSQLGDVKVRNLKNTYGSNGYAVYDFIVNEIFRSGNCSLSCSNNLLSKIANYWGLSFEEVNEIVKHCINIDLFNAELYTKYHILTSADLQQLYRNSCSTVIPEPLALAVNS